jgi:ferrous iron transport protein A
MVSLQHLPVDTWCRVAAQCLVPARLMALGFLPHEQVRVVRRSQFKGGPLVVQIGNAVFALRAEEADQVQVECAA